MMLLAGCRITQSLVLPYNLVGEICMNNRSCLEEFLVRDAAVPSPPNYGIKTKKSLTVFMRPHSSGWAAGAVAGRREAQHRGVILCELLQTRHVAHVDAVLEVWSHCHHGNLLLFARLPGEQLEQDSGGGGEKKCECVRKAAGAALF